MRQRFPIRYSGINAKTMGIPVRLRQLAVSLEDPDGFLGALAVPDGPGPS